jgi:hypothetical protein
MQSNTLTGTGRCVAMDASQVSLRPDRSTMGEL